MKSKRVCASVGNDRKRGMAYGVEIDGRLTGLCFSASHFISGHGICGYLHGHNYSVNVEVDGSPDISGMVVDFFVVEKSMKKVLSKLDHRILIPRRYARTKGNEVAFDSTRGEIRVPRAGAFLVDVEETTAEELASYILRQLMTEIGDDRLASVSRIRVKVYESEGRMGWCSCDYT